VRWPNFRMTGRGALQLHRAQRMIPSARSPRVQNFVTTTSRIEHEAKADADKALAFLDAMVPVLHAAEHSDALLRRRLGVAFHIARYAAKDEISLNRIVADLLSPQGFHGQGSAFLKLFIETLTERVRFDEAEKWRVVPSHRTVNGRYVDLAIFRWNDVAIYLECKPWAEEGQEQLGDYAKDLLKRTEAEKILAFAPGDSEREPETLPREVREKLGDRYTKIPFQRAGAGPSIVEWLERCAEVCEASNVRLFIDDLRDFLGAEFGDEKRKAMAEDSFVDLLKDSVTENKDRLRTVLRLERLAVELRKEIPRRFLRELGAQLRREMGPKWEIDTTEFDGQGNYRKVWLRKTRWPHAWGIVLENGDTEFGSFYIGFCCPTTTQQLKDLGQSTELISERTKQKLYEALEHPLRQIGDNVRHSAWWPAYVALPHPLDNWKTGDALTLLSGLEKLSDGPTAIDALVGWFRSIAKAAEPVIDKVPPQ